MRRTTESTSLLGRVRRLETVLREIQKGPKAEHVNFTKSKEMAEWICWACDRANSALSDMPNAQHEWRIGWPRTNTTVEQS